MEKQYLSVQEFANIAGVSDATIYNMIRDRMIIFSEKQVGRRKVKVIPKSELSKMKI